MVYKSRFLSLDRRQTSFEMHEKTKDIKFSVSIANTDKVFKI